MRQKKNWPHIWPTTIGHFHSNFIRKRGAICANNTKLNFSLTLELTRVFHLFSRWFSFFIAMSNTLSTSHTHKAAFCLRNYSTDIIWPMSTVDFHIYFRKRFNSSAFIIWSSIVLDIIQFKHFDEKKIVEVYSEKRLWICAVALILIDRARMVW